MIHPKPIGEESLCGKAKKVLFYLSPLLLTCTVAFGQVSTVPVDSNAHDRMAEYLQNLITEIKSTIEKSNNQFEELEIDELIVNAMVSKAGNDFFDYFTADFEWPESQQNFIIVISEKPFRASTTQLIITVNDLEVFQNVLQPRGSYLEELADYAQIVTTQYIVNYQQIMHDLDGADRSGTGIY